MKELLRHHLEISNDPIIKVFLYFDQIAVRIPRKIRSPKIKKGIRYVKENIDFVALATEIKEVSSNI